MVRSGAMECATREEALLSCPGVELGSLWHVTEPKDQPPFAEQIEVDAFRTHRWAKADAPGHSKAPLWGIFKKLLKKLQSKKKRFVAL